MRVRKLTALAMLLAATAPAAAQETGGWTVSSRDRPFGGVPIGCALSLPGETTAARLYLRNQPLAETPPSPVKQGPANLRITVPDKVLSAKRGELAGVSITIQGQKTWSGLTVQWAETSDGGTMQAVVDRDIQAMLRPIARGDKLDVSVTPPGGPAKTYSISLKGSNAAISAYQNCLAQIR